MIAIAQLGRLRPTSENRPLHGGGLPPGTYPQPPRMRDPDKMSSAFPLPCTTDPLEDFPIGVYRSAADGTLLYANQALQRMLRFSSRQELLAASVLGTYQHASDREAWLVQIEREGSVTQ